MWMQNFILNFHRDFQYEHCLGRLFFFRILLRRESDQLIQKIQQMVTLWGLVKLVTLNTLSGDTALQKPNNISGKRSVTSSLACDPPFFSERISIFKITCTVRTGIWFSSTIASLRVVTLVNLLREDLTNLCQKNSDWTRSPLMMPQQQSSSKGNRPIMHARDSSSMSKYIS